MSWLERKALTAATRRAQHLMAPGERILATEVGKFQVPGLRFVTCSLLLTPRAVYAELAGQPFIRFDLLALNYVDPNPRSIWLLGPGIDWRVTVDRPDPQFARLLGERMLSLPAMNVTLTSQGRTSYLHYLPWRPGHPASWAGAVNAEDDTAGFAVMQQAWLVGYLHCNGQSQPGVRTRPVPANPGTEEHLTAFAHWLELPPTTLRCWAELLDAQAQGRPVGLLLTDHALIYVQTRESVRNTGLPWVTRIELDRILAVQVRQPNPGATHRVVRVLAADHPMAPGETYPAGVGHSGNKLLLLGFAMDERSVQAAEAIAGQAQDRSAWMAAANFDPLA